MDTRKKIISFLASLSVLSAATGVTAFANNVAADKKADKPAVTDEADTPETTDGDETETPEGVKEDEIPGEDEKPEAPAKPVEKRDILAMIDEVRKFNDTY